MIHLSEFVFSFVWVCFVSGEQRRTEIDITGGAPQGTVKRLKDAKWLMKDTESPHLRRGRWWLRRRENLARCED